MKVDQFKFERNINYSFSIKITKNTTIVNWRVIWVKCTCLDRIEFLLKISNMHYKKFNSKFDHEKIKIVGVNANLRMLKWLEFSLKIIKISGNLRDNIECEKIKK